ncbi:MAG: hypothetical protein IPM46_08040 [Flavobacteriales bacterium]|nr:hypothetical protein [Flavobacteriales bacterium]
MVRCLAPWTLLITAVAHAQPTLDRQVFPSAATVYGYHDTPYMAAGRAGMGMKWDYSSLPLGALVPYQWTTTDIAPGAGAFPSKALVLRVPGEPTAYYQTGDTAFYWLGSYSDTALIRFDPPLAILDLPCTIGTQWLDTGVAAVTGAGRLAMRSTSLQAHADAWGTLIMPYGEVHNVLRVRYELKVTARNDPQQMILSEVRYSWYCDRTPMPLLIITERFGWPPERTLRWLDGTWQTDPASLFRPIVLRPFPDPCDDMTVVDLPATRADRTILQLVDGNGQVRKEWLAEFTGPQTRRLTLQMNDVPSGAYTLSWIGTAGTLGSSRLTKR